jgi:hypothetical protein
MSDNSQVYDILVGNNTSLYQEVYAPVSFGARFLF